MIWTLMLISFKKLFGVKMHHPKALMHVLFKWPLASAADYVLVTPPAVLDRPACARHAQPFPLCFKMLPSWKHLTIYLVDCNPLGMKDMLYVLLCTLSGCLQELQDNLTITCFRSVKVLCYMSRVCFLRFTLCLCVPPLLVMFSNETNEFA